MLILLKLGVNPSPQPRPLGLLPPLPTRWRAFLAGTAIDTAVLLTCLCISTSLRAPDVHHYTVTPIAWLPAGQHLTVVLPSDPGRPEVPISISAASPHQSRPAAPGSLAGSAGLDVHIDMPPLPILPPPSPQAVLRNPGGGTIEPPTVQASAYEVQTDGRNQDISAKHIDPQPRFVTKPSALDLPRGPRFGNGFAGRRGTAGILPSQGAGGGIGNGLGNGVGNGRGPTAPGSGGDFSVREFDPLVILEKPRPAYTAEAKRQRVEGEVVLDVVFEASGTVRVAGVVQSLGYGLDDAAIEAARRIRFYPARHNGNPYDVAAKLRVLFQLAY